MENFIGLKIQIYPTEEQKKEFNKNFGIARYMYNYGIREEEKEYNKNKGFLNKYDLNSKFTEFKNREENSWLLDYDATTMKIVLFDVVNAFKRFFKRISEYPRLKLKKDIYQQYPIRPERMSIYEDHIRIPGIKTDIACGNIPHPYCIGKGYLSKTHPEYRKYRASRIIFDGVHYYLTFEMDIDENINISSYEKYHDKNISKPYSDTIGIDFGFSKKNWIVDSNGNHIHLPDSSKEEKKIKHLQRKLNRQIRTSKTKKRSKNRLKTIVAINKYYKRIVHRKENVIHNYISHEIIQRKPLAVIIENISTTDFLLKAKSDIPAYKRKDYNSNIFQHCLYKFQTILNYKCDKNNINLIKADREFPSSKRCSSCGSIQDIGKRKLYRCPVCGMVMNRDDNAARNLALYPTLVY